MLAALQHTDLPQGISLVFAGGTCLARAHRLVARMSEDVDLKIAITPLPSSKNAARKILGALKETIRKITADLGFPDPVISAKNENHYICAELSYADSTGEDVELRPHLLGLVTVLCRSSERFKLVSGDRRNHEAYGRFQARGRKDCVEQWVVTHACCGRSGYWQIHSGEMDSELSSGRAGIRASG
ncbi:nucleotidyl transferase AbiEii/AbiGii toxin family protein [Acetobacter tropicalis]|uniref:nucleotidyl transferase AbiEii/AbiGii toxin family protein n=1 Tax=Acetobacter tropicalis TaxID=104102 RepID=UPI0038D0F95D